MIYIYYQNKSTQHGKIYFNRESLISVLRRKRSVIWKANNIKRHLILIKYFLLTGPTDANVNDFWRMIYEQKVTKIIMLTKCIEGTKVSFFAFDVSFSHFKKMFVWNRLPVYLSYISFGAKDHWRLCLLNSIMFILMRFFRCYIRSVIIKCTAWKSQFMIINFFLDEVYQILAWFWL